MKSVAILLAGGSGSRMGASVEDKILVHVMGKPVVAHVLQAFLKSEIVDAVVIVARDNEQRKAISAITEIIRPEIPVFFTTGGDPFELTADRVAQGAFQCRCM